MNPQLTAIQNKIYEIRGQRAMLDFDLAALYQVETRTLKQAVRRNIEHFPEDFMLRLTPDEANYLIAIGRSQNVIPPDYNIGSTEMFAFTEEGVAMLSGILRSKVAVDINIAIMRAFVAMRNYIMTTTTVTAELAEIRAKLALLERNDEDNAEAVNDRKTCARNWTISTKRLRLCQSRYPRPESPAGPSVTKPERRSENKKGCKPLLATSSESDSLAEREGFEPPVQLPVHRISSAARSTTPASLRITEPETRVSGLQI